jgi:predicted ester cyclase
MSEASKEIVRKIQEAWNQKRFDDLDQCFAPDFDNSQSAMSGMPKGLAGAKMASEFTGRSFPDRKTEIIEMIAEGDKVFMRCRVSGSNQGGAAWIGAPEPDGKPYTIESWSLYTFKDGKVVKHAGLNDGYSLAMQLGAISPPPAGGRVREGAPSN